MYFRNIKKICHPLTNKRYGHEVLHLDELNRKVEDLSGYKERIDGLREVFEAIEKRRTEREAKEKKLYELGLSKDMRLFFS